MVACGNSNTRERVGAERSGCTVGVILFAFRFVVFFSLRAEYVCMFVSELVGGHFTTLRFGFLAAIAVGGK